MKLWKKSVIFIMIFGILVMMLTGCGAKSDAEKAFQTMMQTLQTGDTAAIDAYYQFDEVSRFLDAEKQQDLLAVVFKTLQEMEYQVTATNKIDGANVTITANVKTLDFAWVMNEYLEAVMTMTADSNYQAQLPNMNAEEYQKILAEQMTEILKQPDIPKAEQELKLTMVKQDGNWMPGGDKNAFFGAFFGNIISAVNSLL